MSVTCGQCDARPTVTFPAARHHCPLAGIKLYCTCVLTTCRGLHSTAERLGFEPATTSPASYRYATEFEVISQEIDVAVFCFMAKFLL